MKEHSLDALLVFGDALHNPAMVYFTGVVHVTEALLALRRDGQPLLFCHAMEREEAAATSLQTRSITDYKFSELLKECNGNHELANARLYQWGLSDPNLSYCWRI